MIQETSKTAYWSEVKPTLGFRQQTVFSALSKYRNMTNSELSSYLSWPINTITPRIKELRNVGLVTEDEKRVCRITGRKVIAWTVVKHTLF